MHRLQGVNRVRSFAKFLKGYMGLAALVTAALPIPVTMWKLIPVFHSQSGMLTVYTPMLCFLIFAFVFYSRHWLGRIMFAGQLRAAARSEPIGPALGIMVLPLFLIVGTMVSINEYHQTLNWSITQIATNYSTFTFPHHITNPQPTDSPHETGSNGTALFDGTLAFYGNVPQIPKSELKLIITSESNAMLILDHEPQFSIPNGTLLMVFYMLIFVFAELAFLVMALKEHLQDVLGFTDDQLLKRSQPAANQGKP